MAPEATRRSYLAILGTTVAGTLAGCAALEDHPGLLVFNYRDEPVAASTSLRRIADDAGVFAETFLLAAGEDARRRIDLTTEPHRIKIDVEDEPTGSRVDPRWRGLLHRGPH